MDHEIIMHFVPCKCHFSCWMHSEVFFITGKDMHHAKVTNLNLIQNTTRKYATNERGIHRVNPQQTRTKNKQYIQVLTEVTPNGLVEFANRRGDVIAPESCLTSKHD